MHKEQQRQQHLKLNSIVSNLAVIVLLNGISLVTGLSVINLRSKKNEERYEQDKEKTLMRKKKKKRNKNKYDHL
jgi:hypothetical protein